MHVIKFVYAPLVSSRISLLFLTKPFFSRMASGTRGQAGGNLPPPPEPSMAQVLRLMLEDREAARAECQANLTTLQHLAQIATTNNKNGGNGDEEPQTKLRDIQNSNPPTFTKATEPLEADDWLQTIENKLEYAGVGVNEKVLYATHFLAGPAGAWWENVCAMQPEGQVMTWDAFKTKFRNAHVPSGLIKIMRDKFLNLKQGGMSVTEYLDKFTT
jgi:hypothetical protein